MCKRIFVLLVFVQLINACALVPKLDEVVPDRRKDYQKSESLPDLEVPPDLTVDALEDPLEIPDEEVTTLSEYEARKGNRAVGVSGQDLSAVGALEGEKWILVQGSTAELWPRLREFWNSRGYTMDIDDPDLGVMETGWLETSNQGISVIRDKFSLFTETAGSAGTTIIYLSNERQERIEGTGEQTGWLDIQSDPDYEKKIVNEMNIYFYGENASITTTSLATGRSTPAASSVSLKPRAEIQDLGADKVFLSLPDEFNKAWLLTEKAILRAGMFIESDDRSKGLYHVLYYEQEGEEGLLSKLKFWEDDEDEGKGFQISLTGVGEKTELVVLDDEGDWVPKEDATKVLTYIQSQYNAVTR